MKAIIFGANGQDGFFLAKLLTLNEVEVILVSRGGTANFIKGDVTDKTFVETLISNHKPDYIFNFAANSSTHYDFLFENHETISTGTLNILNAVYRNSNSSKVFLSGSGLQFENNGKGIKETDPFEARDPYSIARIQTVYAARYFRRLGLDIYVGYFFNHDSNLRSTRHVNQKIAQAAKRIASGAYQTLELGNLGVMKEFSFAGDIVEAVWVFVNNNRGVREAVIGSGKAYSIQHWVELCFQHYNLEWKNHVVVQKDFRTDYQILVSNPETIVSLGWQPKVQIETLCKMFCE